MRTNLATQKPVFQISLLLLIDCIFIPRSYLPFFSNYFLLLSFSRPPGVMSKQKNSFALCGWRVGRNPPSVPSSICLIGEPAPQAELTGVYIPFHSAMGARFIPRPALHPGRPGEHPIIVTRYRDGYRFCAPTQALARHITCYASALWVEFPRDHHWSRDCSPTRHPDLENRKTC